MKHQIDLLKFKKATFGDDLMRVVAESFLVELPSWRKDFIVQANEYNVSNLADLLHKMKGSCFSISAFSAASQFELAEDSLKNSSHDKWKRWPSILLCCIDQIEKELIIIVSKQI